jgi:hypothetical protein
MTEHPLWQLIDMFVLSVSRGNRSTRFNHLKTNELCLVTVLFQKHSLAVPLDEVTEDKSYINLLHNDCHGSRPVLIIQSSTRVFP